MTQERKVYLVRKILNGNQTNKELVEFFRIVKEISFNYLLSLKRKGYRIAESGDTLEDLADCFMAKLFKTESGGFVVWIKYADQNGTPNENSIDVFLRRIVFQKTKQELASYYKSKDKTSYNIRRMIVKFSGGSYDILDKTIIHKDDTGKPVQMLSTQEVSELYAKNRNGGGHAADVALMINSLPANGHARAFRLGDAISIIKGSLPGNGVKVVARQHEDDLFDVVSSSESDGFILKDVAFKFIDSYCQNPNHNTPWAEFDYWPYAPVLKDVILTILEGKRNSVYDCFHKYFPDASYKEYRNFHRYRTDYILKLVMKNLRRYVK